MKCRWGTRAVAALAVGAIAALPGLAGAQAWPAKPIRMIVPVSAGGPMDALTRQVATQLAKALGQPVIVDNVPGAAATIGLERLATSAPDGYTLGTSAFALQTVAPHQSKLPYDTLKSFTAIGGIAGYSFALLVPGNSSINSVQELVARAKASPRKISAASVGVGTATQLALALFSQRAGVVFNQVSYKGSAPMMTDLMGGHIDLSSDVVGGAAPLVATGRLKALATTGARRHRLLPNAPTVAESLPGFELNAWFGLFGPAGLPAEVTRRLNDELAAIRKSPEFNTFIEGQGFDAMTDTSEELAARVKSEYVQWGEVVAKMPAQKN